MITLLENIGTVFERRKRMYIHIAENLQDELNRLREKALDLNDDKAGYILFQLIRIVGDVIAYSPKERRN